MRFRLTSPKGPPPEREWCCVWRGLPHITETYRARTRSKARYKAACVLAENFGMSVSLALQGIEVRLRR